jgi:hypothetical protein
MKMIGQYILVGIPAALMLVSWLAWLAGRGAQFESRAVRGVALLAGLGSASASILIFYWELFDRVVSLRPPPFFTSSNIPGFLLGLVGILLATAGKGPGRNLIGFTSILACVYWLASVRTHM